MIAVCVLIAIGIFAVRLLGFGKPISGAFTYDPTVTETLREYAKHLEESGNPEAAEAVYAKLAASSGADMKEKAEETFPIVGKTEEVDQFDEVFNRVKGGTAQ